MSLIATRTPPALGACGFVWTSVRLVLTLRASIGAARSNPILTAPLNLTMEAGPLARGQGAGARGQEGGPLASEWRAVSASESTNSQWTLWHWKGWG